MESNRTPTKIQIKEIPWKNILFAWNNFYREILTSGGGISMCLQTYIFVFTGIVSKFSRSSDKWMPVIERASWCQAWLFQDQAGKSNCETHWEPCQTNDISWEPRRNVKKFPCPSLTVGVKLIVQRKSTVNLLGIPERRANISLNLTKPKISFMVRTNTFSVVGAFIFCLAFY